MDQSQATSEQIARDDAHLQSLGIKPELRRTLGFLSNFAIAFAFISVSTGSFGNFGVGIGLSGPVFFWTWLMVIGGQTAGGPELRRAVQPLPGGRIDLPVVEATVEPNPRLVHRLVLLLGPGRHRQRGGGHRRLRDLRLPRRRPGVPRLARSVRRHEHAHLHLDDDAGDHDADQCLRRPTAVDHQQHRRRLPRSWGCWSSPWCCCSSPTTSRSTSCSRSRVRIWPRTGTCWPRWPWACYMSIFIVYGFDTAGTFGEETVDAGKQAPRGVLSSILVSGAVGVVFLLGRDPRDSRHAGHDRRGAGWRLPDRDDRDQHPDARGPAWDHASARSTCSSSSPRSSSARWRSRARRAG